MSWRKTFRSIPAVNVYEKYPSLEFVNEEILKGLTILRKTVSETSFAL
jgi:hypothetical protein